MLEYTKSLCLNICNWSRNYFKII